MDEATKILAAGHLHQSLWLPATADHERLRVTFSTTTNFSDNSLPVILFCGPMFGSRWSCVSINKLATDEGVRVIFVDRPSMGGSSPCPLKLRLPIWLETVQALLAKLQIPHVHLVSHSAGTLYLMHTLYHLRDVLSPQAPYVAMVGPWVHSEHSKAMLMSLVAKLPPSWFEHWSGIQKFVATRIMPSAAWSGGAIASFSSLFQAAPGTADAGTSTIAEKLGVPDDVAKLVDSLQDQYLFAESIEAANHEALLCTKRGGDGLWGICEDYAEYVRSLVELEESRRAAAAATPPKLEVRIFFAESDVMIGEGGRKYMEECWAQAGVQDVIDLRTTVMAGTDHETSILDHKKGAWPAVMREVKQLCFIDG